jgi:hypothetical protein
MNEWNKTSATFIECQCFCVLSNFMTKGYRSSHNETAASAWQQQNAHFQLIENIIVPYKDET